jgi:hypothetical protein
MHCGYFGGGWCSHLEYGQVYDKLLVMFEDAQKEITCARKVKEGQIASLLIEIRDYATEIEAKAEEFKDKGDIDMHDFLEWRAMKIKGTITKLRQQLKLKPLSNYDYEEEKEAKQ